VVNSKGEPTRPLSDAPRWLLWSGALAPLVVAASIIEESVVRKAVNPWRQSISLLSEGPHGYVERFGLILGGLLMLVFAWSLYPVWDHSHSRRVARAQAATGVGLILTGAFIQQGLAPKRGLRIPSPWGALTLVGVVHIIAAGLLYGAAVASCIAVMRALPQRPSSQSAWRYCRATAVSILLLLPAFVVAAGSGGPAGLLERLTALFATVWELWFVRLAVTRSTTDRVHS